MDIKHKEYDTETEISVNSDGSLDISLYSDPMYEQSQYISADLPKEYAIKLAMEIIKKYNIDSLDIS